MLVHFADLCKEELNWGIYVYVHRFKCKSLAIGCMPRRLHKCMHE